MKKIYFYGFLFLIFIGFSICFIVYSAATTEWQDCKKAVLDKWLFTTDDMKQSLYQQCLKEPKEQRGNPAEVYPGVIILSAILITFAIPVSYKMYQESKSKQKTLD